MMLVDPLFQRQLVAVCKERRIPVICDEVFSGLWRLGHTSASHLLGIKPDIACFGKLLTAGIAPLAVTLATEEVFDAFSGSTKLQALLHGHSYTAYPVGCAAAAAALKLLQDPRTNPNMCTPAVPGSCQQQPACSGPCGKLLQLWDTDLVEQLSYHPSVQRIVAIGTVCAIELATPHGGYGSNAAAAVVRGLQQRGVFARPVGNVVYLMTPPTTSRDTCTQLLHALASAVADAASAPAGSGPAASSEDMYVV